MMRASPVFVLTVAGLIPVWRYHPSTGAVETAQPAATPTSMPSASRVVPGTAVSTSKGVFQVEVTFRGDRIAAVRMLQAPHHPQTRWAVPELVAETLKAQSAHIDSVSGATITSQGYRASLQAALDAKGS